MQKTHKKNEKLPSLNAIRAFEAVARHRSFTKAGNELGITQSAVSRQIQSLEKEVGFDLFRRRGRALGLTVEGNELLPPVAESLGQLRSAIDGIRSRHAVPPFTLSMLPSVAAKWLAPRLPALLGEIPDLNLRLHASRELVDFERDSVQAAVRYGRGEWANHDAAFLFRERVFPVASPELLARLGGLKTAESFLAAPLLHGDNPDTWEKWFLAAGLPPFAPRPNPTFTDESTLLEAAVDGLGLALGRTALILEDVRANRLAVASPLFLNATFSYWLVTQRGRAPHPRLAAVAGWLKRAADAFVAEEREVFGWN